jgi:hypothetical protein
MITSTPNDSGVRGRPGRSSQAAHFSLAIFLATLIAASNPRFSFTALTRAFCLGPSWRMSRSPELRLKESANPP